MKRTKKQIRHLFYQSHGTALLEEYEQSGGEVDWAPTEFDGRTLLSYASMTNDMPRVKWLLARGADPNTFDAKTKENVLHIAIGQFGELAIVKMLLDAGADIDAADKWGWTPLHHASYWKCNSGIIPLLIKRGANLQARSEKLRSNYGDGRVKPGSLAIHAALIDDNKKAMKQLYPHQGNLGFKNADTLLIHAATFDASSKGFLVDFLVKELKEDPNAQNDFGWTALHYACHDFVDVAMVEALIAKGADPLIVSTRRHKKMPIGSTALQVAQASHPAGAIQIAKLL